MCLGIIIKTYDAWKSVFLPSISEPPSWEILLIHLADPQSRPVVITIFARVVYTSVRPPVRLHFSKSRKTKQTSSENSDCYLCECGSGRVDHWWHTCLFLPYSASRKKSKFASLLAFFFTRFDVNKRSVTIYSCS